MENEQGKEMSQTRKHKIWALNATRGWDLQGNEILMAALKSEDGGCFGAAFVRGAADVFNRAVYEGAMGNTNVVYCHLEKIDRALIDYYLKELEVGLDSFESQDILDWILGNSRLFKNGVSEISSNDGWAGLQEGVDKIFSAYKRKKHKGLDLALLQATQVVADKNRQEDGC